MSRTILVYKVKTTIYQLDLMISFLFVKGRDDLIHNLIRLHFYILYFDYGVLLYACFSI